MPNDFSNDSSCVAVWRFEDSPGFLIDSKGNNDLTNSGADVETTTVFEGAQAAKFIDSNGDYMMIADADLDAGFPFRYTDGGSTIKDITLAVRFYVTSLPSPLQAYLFSKYDYTVNNRTWAVKITTTDLIDLSVGYNNGDIAEAVQFGTACQTGRWYSLAVTYVSSTKAYRIRVYDHTAGNLLDTDTTGNFAQTISIEDTAFFIGSNDGSKNYFPGMLDEYAVFNRALSVDEIDDIREGIFGAGWSGKINESLVIIEGLVTKKTLLRIISATLEIIEVVRKSITLKRIMSEMVEVVENIKGLRTLKRMVSEVVETVESIGKAISSQLAKIISETVSIIESVTRKLILSRIVSEAVSIVESIKRSRVMFRVLSAIVSVIETIERTGVAGLLKYISETVSISESYIKRVGVEIIKEALRITFSMDTYRRIFKMDTYRRGFRKDDDRREL